VAVVKLSIAKIAKRDAVVMTDLIALLLGGGNHATFVALNAVAMDAHGTTHSVALAKSAANVPYADVLKEASDSVVSVDAAVAFKE